MYNVYNKF